LSVIFETQEPSAVESLVRPSVVKSKKSLIKSPESTDNFKEKLNVEEKHKFEEIDQE